MTSSNHVIMYVNFASVLKIDESQMLCHQLWIGTLQSNSWLEPHSLYITYPNGVQEFHFGNGQKEKHFPDGTKEVLYSNQVRLSFAPSAYDVLY
jgi:hypothetical protein